MYDLVVLGDSPSAAGLCRAAAASGRRVALVARPGWGTSQVVIHGLSREVVREAIRGLPGQAAGTPTAALDALRAELARRQRIFAASLSGTTVDLLTGQARFAAFDAIEVNGRTIKAGRFVIAAQGVPERPAFPTPHGDARLLDTSSFWRLSTSPSSIIIVGDGEAWEYAQLLTRLGITVTLAVGSIDAIVAPLAATLRVQGVRVMEGTPRAVESRGSRLVLRLDGDDAAEVDAEAVLLAGRRMNPPDVFGLERLGIRLAADRTLHVAGGRIWAIETGVDAEMAALQARWLLASWTGGGRFPPRVRVVGTDPAVVLVEQADEPDALAGLRRVAALPATGARGVAGRVEIRMDRAVRVIAAGVCDREAARLLPLLERAVREGWRLDRVASRCDVEPGLDAAFAMLARESKATNRRGLGSLIRRLAGYVADEPSSPAPHVGARHQAAARRP